MSDTITDTATIVLGTKSGSIYVLTAETETTYTLHVVQCSSTMGYAPGMTIPNCRIVTPRIGQLCHITSADDGSHVLATSNVTSILRLNAAGLPLPADPYAV